MKTIEGNPVSLKTLLLNNRYSIHYYQREYMWQEKQIGEMIEDLTFEFLSQYNKEDPRTAVQYYGAYFMGSIVLAGDDLAIIDGQQRLSTLTLLLIFLRRRLFLLNKPYSTLEQMIYSESYGVKSFNIDVEERRECMQAIFDGKDYDSPSKSESSINLFNGYLYIDKNFPKDQITDAILEHFCDWLIEKTMFIRICAKTEQDAYRVFILMNDRGLRLTSTEMLKGYLLSQIKDDNERESLNDKWKEKINELKVLGDKEDESFIKTWLRAQYAETIREKRANSEPKDFDNIGTTFHKWVIEEHRRIGLNKSDDYVHFIRQMLRFADIYIYVRHSEQSLKKESEYVYYNCRIGFTLQPQLLLAPVCEEDSEAIRNEKINLTARFIDLLIVSRVTKSRSVDYGTIKDYVFRVTKDIRRLPVPELKEKLMKWYTEEHYNPSYEIPKWGLNQFTKKYIKNLLARVTGYIEEHTLNKSNYSEYTKWDPNNPYEIEHIISDHYEWYKDDYNNEYDFNNIRNNIGDLLLLRKRINASLNDMRYEQKLPTYGSTNGNIYAASLGQQAYINNPAFIAFIKSHNLPFQSYNTFGKYEIASRAALLAHLVELVWNDEMFH